MTFVLCLWRLYAEILQITLPGYAVRLYCPDYTATGRCANPFSALFPSGGGETGVAGRTK